MEEQKGTNVSSVKESSISMKSEEISQESIYPISLVNEVLTDEDIPIVTEENYKTWKDKMGKFLKNKGLWDYVIGTKGEPENTSSEEYKDWKQKKEEIISIFRKKCGTRTLPYIERLDITLIWSQLVTMYEFTYPTNTGIKRRSTNYTWCVPFYNAIVEGNWKTVSQFLVQNEKALTMRLTSEGDLPLHVAVQKGKVDIAKELIKLMSEEDLSGRGKEGKTVLHIAASSGNIEIVKAIVEKNEKLVMIKSKYYQDCIPIILAAMAGYKDVVNYLYPITIRQDGNQKEDHTGKCDKTRATILDSLIFCDFYGQALDLLQKYPHLVLTKDEFSVWTAIESLSVKPTAFQSSLLTDRSIGSLGYYFMYLLLDVHIEAKIACLCTSGDVENSFDTNGGNNQGNMVMCGLCTRSKSRIFFQFCKGLWLRFHWLFQKALIKLVPGCKNIYEEKLKHYEASKLLKEIWRIVSELDGFDHVVKDIVFNAMLLATQYGIVEFIQECINNCPQLLKLKSTKAQKGQTIFHYAISNRQEKIFGLIHHLGPMKQEIAWIKDASGNFISHLAAKKAPIQRLNQVPGAALQMQRELLWYKEVESIMTSSYDILKNNEGKTPRILFTEEHKELVKDGAAWMKDTSTQCMVIATLITTIMFQAAFTVPGHAGGGGGEEPDHYIQGKFSIAFVISNILALCSSVASMLMFLAIITSRYAEEDFLSTLPRMLMLGLFFLFVSIVGMMIAFVAAILFMMRYDVRLWVSLPIVFLASIPVTIYALVELPLFMQLMFTTSSSNVFGKRRLSRRT